MSEAQMDNLNQSSKEQMDHHETVTPVTSPINNERDVHQPNYPNQSKNFLSNHQQAGNSNWKQQ